MRFSCLEPEVKGPGYEEIPDNEINLANRWINLAIALGAWDGVRTNWAEECSSIIDTGFNGGGMCIYAWFRRCDEYIRSFYPTSNFVKTKGGSEICVSESPRTGVGCQYLPNAMGEWFF